MQKKEDEKEGQTEIFKRNYRRIREKDDEKKQNCTEEEKKKDDEKRKTNLKYFKKMTNYMDYFILLQYFTDLLYL